MARKNVLGNRTSKIIDESETRNHHGRLEPTDLTMGAKSPTQHVSREILSKPVVEKLKKRAPDPQLATRLPLVYKKKDSSARPAQEYGSPYAPISDLKQTSLAVQPILCDSSIQGIDASHSGGLQKLANDNRNVETHVLPPARLDLESRKDASLLLGGREKNSPKTSSVLIGNHEIAPPISHQFGALLQSAIYNMSFTTLEHTQLPPKIDFDDATEIEMASIKQAPEFRNISEARSVLQTHMDSFITDHQYFLTVSQS